MNKKTRVIGLIFAGVVLCLFAGCSRVPNTKLKVLLPEGTTSAKIYVLDYELDTNVAAVNNVVNFVLPSNKAVAGTVSIGRSPKGKTCTFVPDGTALTINMTEDKPAPKSNKAASVNNKLLSNKEYEMRSASEYAQKVQGIRGNQGMPEESRDSLLKAATKDFQKLITGEYLKRAKENKDNYIGAEAIVRLRGKLPNEVLDSLISTMDPAVVESSRVDDVRKTIQAQMKTDEGMPFADFTVKDGEKEIHLSDYVGKGKYVLAYFWTSWNQPSLVALPALKELNEKFAGDRFMMLGVSVWDDPDKARATAIHQKLPWTGIYDASEALRAYGVTDIPYLILFAPDGKIVRRGIALEDLGKMLSFYL